MELNINNEITNKQIENTEITDFINELSSTLEKKQELQVNNNLYNEILKDVELAPKYRNKLQSVINKCLEDMSYRWDFFYFDYDKQRKDYCLKYYWNGGKTVCDELSKEDINEFKRCGFTFFEPIDEDGTIKQADNIKDWIKCEVESSLVDLEIQNKKEKGK